MLSGMPVTTPSIKSAMARLTDLEARQADLGHDAAGVSDVVFADPDLQQALARHLDLVDRVRRYQNKHHARKVPLSMAQDLHSSLIRALRIMGDLVEGELDKPR